jgi:hypothetical protein
VVATGEEDTTKEPTMMVYHPDIARTLATARQRDLERSAAKYRLAKLVRRDRTAHTTPSIRPAPVPLRAPSQCAPQHTPSKVA